MRIFAGNLPFDTTDAQLRALFEIYGEVDSAKHLTDRETQRPRGFGFVVMPNQVQAVSAIQNLDRSEIGGRLLNVSEARPHEHQQRSGG